MREFDGGVMALRIAFCDDEATQLALTDALLREYGLLHPKLALRAFPFPSGAALLEQLRTIDKRRLKERVCHLDGEILTKVDKALEISLELPT